MVCNIIDTVFFSDNPAPQYTLTPTNDGNGTTDPAVPTVVDSGVAIPITATSNAHYHFLTWTTTAGSGVTYGDATDSTTTVTLEAGNATIRADFGSDTVEVTLGTDAHGTITSPCPDQIFAYGETDTVIFTPAANYRVVGATDKLPDTSIFQPTADTTVDTAFELFPTYTIDTTKVGLGTWAIAGGLTQDSGVTVAYSAAPTSGWSFVRYGGTFTGTSAVDSFVIAGNHSDSAIFMVVPVIDSIRDSTELRDSTNHQAGRPLDTMIAYGVGFSTLGDSTQMNLNSTGSVRGTILSISDTKIVFIIPPLPPRIWMSSWVRTKDMVSGTPLRHALLIKRPGGL
jgi:hypothetical protein